MKVKMVWRGKDGKRTPRLMHELEDKCKMIYHLIKLLKIRIKTTKIREKKNSNYHNKISLLSRWNLSWENILFIKSRFGQGKMKRQENRFNFSNQELTHLIMFNTFESLKIRESTLPFLKYKEKGNDYMWKVMITWRSSTCGATFCFFFYIKTFILGIIMQFDISVRLTPQVTTIICHHMKKVL